MIWLFVLITVTNRHFLLNFASWCSITSPGRFQLRIVWADTRWASWEPPFCLRSWCSAGAASLTCFPSRDLWNYSACVSAMCSDTRVLSSCPGLTSGFVLGRTPEWFLWLASTHFQLATSQGFPCKKGLSLLCSVLIVSQYDSTEFPSSWSWLKSVIHWWSPGFLLWSFGSFCRMCSLEVINGIFCWQPPE